MSFLVKQVFNGTFEMKPLKMSRTPPQGNASLEIFLGQIQRELFEVPKKRLIYSSF